MRRGYDVVETPSDVELVDALRSGSGSALGELFDRHADRIYTYCFRRTASWATAEDATSTVFLEAWRSRDRAEAYDDAALPWLYGIATNVCRNLTRSQRRHAAALGSLPRPTDSPDHADAVGERVDSERTMARIVEEMAALLRARPRGDRARGVVGAELRGGRRRARRTGRHGAQPALPRPDRASAPRAYGGGTMTHAHLGSCRPMGGSPTTSAPGCGRA